MAALETYWWIDHPNFGDALNPVLLERLFGVQPVWTDLHRAAMICVGSILQDVARVLRTGGNTVRAKHVWGSGYILDNEPPIDTGRITYHAVRGEQTKAYSNICQDIPLGDPVVLSSFLLDAPVPKKFAVGIVPHYGHRRRPDVLLVEHQPQVTIIDVTADPIDIVAQIAACEFVYSSSLHGLVVADSLGVPNQWIEFSSPLHGAGFKFADYYSSFGMTAPAPLRFDASCVTTVIVDQLGSAYSPRPGLERMQKTLEQSFPF